ncbi:MAG: hypothetical protein AB7N76_09840 [Planctomycetota bacterium]
MSAAKKKAAKKKSATKKAAKKKAPAKKKVPAKPQAATKKAAKKKAPAKKKVPAKPQAATKKAAKKKAPAKKKVPAKPQAATRKATRRKAPAKKVPATKKAATKKAATKRARVPEVLLDPVFWRYYQLGREHAPDAEWKRQYSRELNAGEWEPLRFSLDCGAGRVLVVTARLDYYALDLELEEPDGALHTLGWWDEARWHPYALRWEEAVALLRAWRRRPTGALGSPWAAFLLIARFVGLSERLAGERFDEVFHAYLRLDLKSATARRLALGTVTPPTDADYRWSEDPELGWVFGGDYACYTLRNRAHLDGNEGRFPFEAFAALIAGLRG